GLRPRVRSRRGGGVSAAVGICRGSVVVAPRSRGPRSVKVSVKRPVWRGGALAGAGERASLGRVRREPQPAVPCANSVARAILADLERQHALGTESILGLLVGHQLRRAAELAALRLALRIEHRNRLAALALDVALF